MNRRKFLTGLALLGASTRMSAGATVASDLNAHNIPRWRGFNLQAMIAPPGGPYDEFDFATMAAWGFDFTRLPLSYWTWGSRDDWSVIREEPLRHIDRAIELGRQYGMHINLSFHRAPGYCINERNLEPADLFTGPPAEQARALRAAVFHWQAYARRYKGIPNRRLSFDLVNEPPKMKTPDRSLEDRYVEIARALVAGIREIDPDRLIFADGLDIGQKPVMGLVKLNLVQSTRGYLPKAVSHYTATWVPKDEFETFKPPTWPLRDDLGQIWDRARLKRELIETYRPLLQKRVRVHVGEWGCFNKTPHAVALAWMEDCLALWKEAGWGNALWNLRGSFGVLDSGREDVRYEDFKGHKLDRRMLELLRSY
ncbi:MAG: glycoside hydrolase family 5 protein [Pyrinomonadaceae bacterium]